MYYIWEHERKGSTQFFSCGMEQFEGWTNIPWNMGKELTQTIPSTIKYFANNGILPEDYPRTGTGFHFLISEKIVNILRKLDVQGIEYYDSIIIRPDSSIISGFSTINIINVLDCLNRELSDYEIKKYGPAEVFEFNKICLSRNKIPENIKLFHLKEQKSLTFVHESLKNIFEREGISGISFKPVEVI